MQETKLRRFNEARLCGERNLNRGELWREGEAGRWTDNQKEQNWATGSRKRIAFGGNDGCQPPGVQVRVIQATVKQPAGEERGNGVARGA